MSIRRTAGVAASSLLALTVVGGGIAMASDGAPAPASGSTSSTVVEDTDVNSGPDADANEPGHQDASDAGDEPEGTEAG